MKNELFEENQNTIVSGTFVELRQNFGNFLWRTSFSRTQENINTIVSGTFWLDLFNFIFRQHFLRQNFLHNLSSMWCIGFLSPSLSLSCMCHWLNLKPFLANRAPLILASSVNTQQRRNLFVVSFYFGIDYLLFRWLTLIKFCKYTN